MLLGPRVIYVSDTVRRVSFMTPIDSFAVWKYRVTGDPRNHAKKISSSLSIEAFEECAVPAGNTEGFPPRKKKPTGGPLA